MKKWILFFLMCKVLTAGAQTDTILFTRISGFTFENFLPYSAFTANFDQGGSDYIYSACRDLGLVTFDMSDPLDPQPVDTVSVPAFHNLKPTNISQRGNYLYAALGSFDGLFPQHAGLAILDIADPAHPVITDEWDSTAFAQGAAIAITDDHYAYLGAMDAGVVILNIDNKNNIQFVSSILPDPNFPEVPGLFSVPNARGLALKGEDTLMVAYDASGLRMIDISNRNVPLEIGKYVNVGIEAVAQSAYNNIAIVGNHAYVPVDMCGLDVVNIADHTMETELWFNPWDCDSSNWVGRPGHTNEVRVIGDSLLFVSGGDSEALAFDISNPAVPKLVGEYANVYDSIVAWSLDVRPPYVSLALIDNSFVGIPYYSDIGGIAVLQMEMVPYSGIDEADNNTGDFQIVPDPVQDAFMIQSKQNVDRCIFYDLSGRIVQSESAKGMIPAGALAPGMYIIQLIHENHCVATLQFIKE